MRILPASPENITRGVECIRSGGVVAHATETCYGLACDVQNPKALALLFSIKHRPPKQPISILFQSVDQAKCFTLWSEHAEALAKLYLPGPVTLILKANLHAPSRLFVTPSPSIEGPQTIGVRVSPHPVALAIVQGFGAPISTTSANVHGLPNPYSMQDIEEQFADRSDVPTLVLDSGDLPKNKPSTVMDCTGSTPTTRRMGNVEISKG
jgi:L-threonylcarbamoyladenylate synthase